MFENSKIFYLELVKYNGKYYKNIPKILINDIEILLEANKTYPKSILYTSEKNKNNKELILILIKNNINSYNYISEPFKNNEEILLKAIRNCSNFLSQEFNRLESFDKYFILKVINIDIKNYKFIPDKFKNDNFIILELIKTNTDFLRNNPNILNDCNKDIILKIINLYSKHNFYIPHKYKINIQIIFTKFRDNKEIVLEFLKTHCDFSNIEYYLCQIDD